MAMLLNAKIPFGNMTQRSRYWELNHGILYIPKHDFEEFKVVRGKRKSQSVFSDMLKLYKEKGG